MTNSTNSSALDALLDMQLDDMKDLPEFKVLNAGAHKVTIDFEVKDINKHPAVEVKVKLVETLELADPSQTPDEVGTESSMACMMDNEFGQGALKAILKPLCEHFGTQKFGEIREQAKGMEVVVVTKQRQNKEKTATYLSIEKLLVV